MIAPIPNPSKKEVSKDVKNIKNESTSYFRIYFKDFLR